MARLLIMLQILMTVNSKCHLRPSFHVWCKGQCKGQCKWGRKFDVRTVPKGGGGREMGQKHKHKKWNFFFIFLHLSCTCISTSFMCEHYKCKSKRKWKQAECDLSAILKKKNVKNNAPGYSIIIVPGYLSCFTLLAFLVHLLLHHTCKPGMEGYTLVIN